MNTKTYLKIASQVYTYLVDAEDNSDNEITLKQLKNDIMGKRDDVVCNKIKSLEAKLSKTELINFINEKDSKGYTLLMLAASNNLIKTVKQLIICGADTSITVKIKGELFKKILNYKIKNDMLVEEEIEELKKQKQYNAMAIDIAEVKGFNNIVQILK